MAGGRLGYSTGHRHHHWRGFVRALNELDLFDFFTPLGMDGEIANLSPSQPEGEFRSGNILSLDVIGEMDAVFQRVVLGLAILVMESEDDRNGAFLTVGISPAAHPTQTMDRFGARVVRDHDLFGHLRRILA